MSRNRPYLIDIGALTLLAAWTLYYAARFVRFDIPPFEDAAMLMRYADHLARGYGMAWNVGEPPVDGATDFLLVVVAAALIQLGMPVGRAVRAIGMVAHVTTVMLLYAVNRRRWQSGVIPAAFSALYLSVGTGLAYVAAFFGTPFFALAVTVAWALALRLGANEESHWWTELGFSIAALIVGLIRPEGVILAVLMLVAILVMRSGRHAGRLLIVFCAAFLLAGGAYFVWRWDYFGYPLPNPFYKKGAGLLHWDSLIGSMLNTLRLGLPFLPAFLLAFADRSASRRAVAALIPVIGFAASFVLISDETNYGARFQYALLPIILLSWYPLVSRFAATWRPRAAGRERIAWTLAATSLVVIALFYSWSQNCRLHSYQRTCAAPYADDGRYDLGRMLGEYRGRGYTIATTEAGLLPYYSGWTAIDTWGLNDPWIAHNGEVTPEYLDRYRPHVIAFHAYFSPLVPPKRTEANLQQDWFRMTITLVDYAESRGYTLAAVFGDSPYDTMYYYVRPDFVDSARLTRQIASMTRYYWFTTGKKSINYARLALP